MSIVKAINELSGKEATTIEKAIKNLEPGGGGESDVFMVHITAIPDFSTNPPTTVYNLDKTYEEVNNAYNSGKVVVIESGSANGAIFTKFTDGTETFYSTSTTSVSKLGANAIIKHRYFILTRDDALELVENSIKVATVN